MGGQSTAIMPVPGTSFIIDFSDYPDAPALPLKIRCKSCRRMFACDYEEQRCPRCVALNELPQPVV